MRTFFYLTTKDEANRFWSIDREGPTITIETGRLCTWQGEATRETQTLGFPDEEAARAEHDRRVAEWAARVGVGPIPRSRAPVRCAVC
jgi:predicted DNA-binding WGR domain protein